MTESNNSASALPTSLPAPRLLDPASVPVMRWGVIGAGEIAKVFVAAVQKHSKQNIVAVASRTPGKAQEFAAELGLEAHDNYEDLLARDDLDAIYIATLPSQHRDHALMAIAAGKHVLIEKPVALVVEEAAEIFAAAKAANLLAMEAMWTRYLPQYDIARQLLADGAIGEPQMFNAIFASRNLHVARLWTKNFGDPMFDMGIYLVSLAQDLMGNPSKITASAKLNADGIDEEVSLWFDYDNGGRAHMILSGIATAPLTATLSGSAGHLQFGHPFIAPASITLAGNDFYFDSVSWQNNTGIVGHEGLSIQANFFAKYVAEGLLESPLESHADSLANLEVCAEIVRQIGAEIF